MDEPRRHSDQEDEGEDEYGLEQGESPATPAHTLPERVLHPDDETDFNPEHNQFSLRELLGLGVVVSVVFSIITTIARTMPQGQTPAGLAAITATILGFGTLAAMVFVSFIPASRRIVFVGLWMLLGLYLVACLAATMMPK